MKLTTINSSSRVPPNLSVELCDVRALTRYLVHEAVIHPEEWDVLSKESREQLAACADAETLLEHLIALKLVNAYQAEHIQAGALRGLVLGNYRVLGNIGQGGSGVIFEAEHMLMRRKVAIKVVPLIPTNRRIGSPAFFARCVRWPASIIRTSWPPLMQG